MPINMTEATHEQLFYQLERCYFALSTMTVEIRELMFALDDESKEWPEDADIMLEEVANAIGDADDKSCIIVGQIRQYIN